MRYQREKLNSQPVPKPYFNVQLPLFPGNVNIFQEADYFKVYLLFSFPFREFMINSP